jgi:hypothetical protein
VKAKVVCEAESDGKITEKEKVPLAVVVTVYDVK